MDWGLNIDGAGGSEWALVEDEEAWAFIPAFGYQTEPGGARFFSPTSVGRGGGLQKRATEVLPLVPYPSRGRCCLPGPGPLALTQPRDRPSPPRLGDSGHSCSRVT